MTGKRFNIDINDNSLINRVFKIALGILCFLAAGYFMYSITGTSASTVASWAAIVFLIFFGLWGILSGTGTIDKYIIIDEDRITLRKNPFLPPVEMLCTDIQYVEFGPLNASFVLKKGDKIILKLGTYNRERSALIMEAIEQFCINNKVDTKGLEKQPEE